jgi:hypothetical protein
MTVSSTTLKNSYTATSSQTTFAYAFKIFADGDLKVYVNATLKTLTTDYTVTSAGVTAGGNVVFGTGLTSGDKVIIQRDLALTQSTDYVENDPFPADSHETALDRLTFIVQQLNDGVESRSFKFAKTVTDAGTIEISDDSSDRASKTIGFDSSGDLTTVADFLPKGGDSALFQYSTTTTDSDPGGGYLRFNHATISSATILYVDDLDYNTTDVSAWVQSFDDVSGNATNRGRIRVSKAGALDVWHSLKVSAAVTDASGYTKITFVYIDGAGTLAADDKVWVSFTASGEDGAIPGYRYTFDTSTTDADPGAGDIRFNNGTYASATAIYIDDADADGGSTQADTETWGDSTETIKGYLHITDMNDITTYARFKITAAVTDASGYNKITVVHLASNNTFSASDELSVHFTRNGDAGASAGYFYKFDTGTSDTDPGAGEIAFNNGTYASATAIYIDDVDQNSVNTVTDVLTWDDSSSTIKGYLHIVDINDHATYARFSITGSSTDASGYNKLSVTHIASNNTFSAADSLAVHFTRQGDKGTTGDTGATGSTAGTSGLGMTWDNSTSDADNGAGKIAWNHATISSATVLYVDDADDASADISGFVQSWDDVSNSTARGYVQITKEGATGTYAVFKVNGAVTDASGYTKVPVAHVVSAGSFSDDDGVGVQFVQSGADGSGDITAVVAGTNLSGGATSGSATITLADASTSAKGAASFSSSDFDVSSGAVSLKDNSITLAYMAGGTDGNIISYDANGDPVAIATGSDGEVLTSAGAGQPPAFEAAGGGVDLDGAITINESGADVDFRVESDTKTHMLTVDGGNDVVGISSGGFMGDLGTGLHVKTADSGASSASADGSEIVVEGSGNSGIGILSGTGNNGHICFGDSGDNDIGRLVYRHADNSMAIDCLAGEVARFMAYGLLIGRTSFVGGTGAVIQVNADIKSSGGGGLLTITASTGTADACIFHNGNGEVGSITTASSATAYNTSSDYRLKENETAITDGIDRIKQLKPYRFNFKADADTNVDGFFAHEVSGIVPEAITGEKDATKTYTDENGDEQTRILPQGIDQSKLVPLLTSALQEAITKIETLEAKVTALENA